MHAVEGSAANSIFALEIQIIIIIITGEIIMGSWCYSERPTHTMLALRTL